MLWTQVGASFVAWLGVGVWAGRWARTDSRLPSPPLAGTGLMVAGAGIMFLVMWAMGSARPIVNGSLVPWAWLASTLAGAVFVGLQVVGCVWTVRRVLKAETAPGSNASESQEHPS